MSNPKFVMWGGEYFLLNRYHKIGPNEHRAELVDACNRTLDVKQDEVKEVPMGEVLQKANRKK